GGMSGNAEGLAIGASTMHRWNDDDRLRDHFDGEIDNILVFDRALKPAEAALLADGGGVAEALDPLYTSVSTDTSAATTITHAGTRYSDSIKGSMGDDVVAGFRKDDKLWGRDGDDVLLGAGGGDDLRGGTGMDRLEGGKGRDILKGGQNSDTFVLEHFGSKHRDTIVDFVSGEDRIEIAQDSLGVADGFTLANLSEGSLLTYDAASGKLRFDTDGAGGDKGEIVALFDPGTLLDVEDIHIA
ncbi:MAG: hypothetical protein AAFX00_05040, partial [Pseudomonadota bacterium]